MFLGRGKILKHLPHRTQCKTVQIVQGSTKASLGCAQHLDELRLLLVLTDESSPTWYSSAKTERKGKNRWSAVVYWTIMRQKELLLLQQR